MLVKLHTPHPECLPPTSQAVLQHAPQVMGPINIDTPGVTTPTLTSHNGTS